MCWGRTLERIHRSGDIDVFPKLSMAREPSTDDCKSQGTQNYSRLQSQNKWSEVDGMKSVGRRALRHPPLSNMRYSVKLYNVEGLDHKVHEPVTVSGMADMQSQEIEEWPKQVSTSFEQEHKGEWWLNVGSINSIYKTGSSLQHMRHR